MRVGAAYFLEPSEPAQRRYEAMRAYFVDGLTAGEVATRFGYSPASVRDHSCPGGQAVRSQGRQRALRSRPSPSGRRARAQERRRAAPNRQSTTEVAAALGVAVTSGPARVDHRRVMLLAEDLIPGPAERAPQSRPCLALPAYRCPAFPHTRAPARPRERPNPARSRPSGTQRNENGAAQRCSRAP